MKKLIILATLILFLGVFCFTQTIYHVSQVDGNDSYNGLYQTFQGGSDGPWLTLGRADNLSGDQSDNAVYLKRGGIWREYPVIGANGTDGSPFTWGAYGTGDDPEIWGSVEVATWSDAGSNVWYASVASDPRMVWFRNTDTTVNFGLEVANKAAVDTEYDWFWSAADLGEGTNVLYVYAASDPDSRYTTIEEPRNTWTILQSNGNNYVTFENLNIGFGMSGGLRTYGGATNTVIQDCEFHNLRTGVSINPATNCLVTRCDFHDMDMEAAMYSGALGVAIQDSDNEVSYCTFLRCRAPSDHYNWDGGCVELYGQASRSYIHHNWGYRCQGFCEIGGGSVVTVSDVRIEYNIAFDNGRFTGVHLSGTFEIDLDNCHVYNNTAVQSDNGIHAPLYAMLYFSAPGGAGDYYLRNNIFYCDGGGLFSQGWDDGDSPEFDHDHNDYYLINMVAGGLNITADGTDIEQDPKFTNYDGTNDYDYRLAEDSPCIDDGTDLSLTADYFDNTVPFNATPDMGAHEFYDIAKVIIIGEQQ